MKKIILINFIILLSLFKIYSQEKNYFSIQGDADYYYYFIDKYKNNFNYGFSLMGSKYFNKFKFSAGINYSTKSYFFANESKLEYNLKYLNYILVGNYNLLSNKNFLCDFLLGVKFNQIIDYREKFYYENGNIRKTKLTPDNYLGISLTSGFNFSTFINKNILINFSPFIDFKIKQDQNAKYPNMIPLPIPLSSSNNDIKDKLSLGFTIGIEYLFKKSEQ